MSLFLTRVRVGDTGLLAFAGSSFRIVSSIASFQSSLAPWSGAWIMYTLLSLVVR